jgi:hypothetical protein
MSFSTYINDITNRTGGICRLYADDTFLGHYINVLLNVQFMAYSGLSNIKRCSEDWLITSNPNKMGIMLFDGRRQGNVGKQIYTPFTFINTRILCSVLPEKVVK